MMFRFAHPHVLWLLLLLPLWIWARFGARFRAFLHHPAGDALRELPDSWARRLYPLPTVLGGIGITLLIVALARPQSGLLERRVTADTVDIVLAIDTSTSMEAIDLSDEPESTRNRLDAVIGVAEDFIEGRQADRIGLVAFAAQPYTVSPLTLDKGWLLGRLREMETGTLPDGTAVGSALVSAVNRLRDSEAETKIVVLLTDGINNAGDIEPLDAAPLAEALGIRVYTIGAGSSGLVRYPQTTPFGRTVYQQVRIPIDTETLRRIADITGGRFFRAESGEELEAVFEEIDEMERTEVELTEYTLYTEHFFWFAAAGLALALLDRLLSAGRLGRAAS